MEIDRGREDNGMGETAARGGSGVDVAEVSSRRGPEGSRK